MHSSRMRTARSSSRPWRGVGVCLSACWDTPPPVWGWRTPGCGPGETPPGHGPGDPPSQTPPLPPWVWTWRPPHWRPVRHAGIPPARHAGIPPARHAGIPPPRRPAARHAGIPPPPPVNRITDTCKNITLPQLRCGR